MKNKEGRTPMELMRKYEYEIGKKENTNTDNDMIGISNNNNINIINDTPDIDTNTNTSGTSNKKIYSALVESIFHDLKGDSLHYLESHNEIITLIDELLAEVMFHQPANVAKFSEKFFRSKRKLDKKNKVESSSEPKDKKKVTHKDKSYHRHIDTNTDETNSKADDSTAGTSAPTGNSNTRADKSFLVHLYDAINNSITPEVKLIILGAFSSAIASVLHNKFSGNREQVHCSSHTIHN